MTDFLNLDYKHTLLSETATYRNLQRLGVGGSAETYLMVATSGNLRGQLFAVKLFRRLFKPNFRTNFLSEIKFLQGCNHPALMRVFDEGTYQEEHPFVVAEYLPDTLEAILRSNPPMMSKMAFAIQLLSALEYLSKTEISVLHRDIKPANIFIKGGSCVLGDFGLLKRLSDGIPEDQTEIRESVGPGMPRRYRTPDLVEYFRNATLPSTKSDIYQLGLVFAEMFSGKNPQQPMKTDNYAEPIELSSFYVPGGMGKLIKPLILRMLESDPAKRPSASEIIPQWHDQFLEAAERSHELEGRVF